MSSLKIETKLPKIVHEIHAILHKIHNILHKILHNQHNESMDMGCQFGQAYSRKGKTIGW